PRLRHFLHHAVRRKQHVRPVADKEAPGDLYARGFKGFDLGEQRAGIDDQAIADDRLLARAQDAARDQLENIFLLAYKNGMAGVMPALIPRDDVELLGKEIDDLPLALVSPLGSQDD